MFHSMESTHPNHYQFYYKELITRENAILNQHTQNITLLSVAFVVGSCEIKGKGTIVSIIVLASVCV